MDVHEAHFGIRHFLHGCHMLGCREIGLLAAAIGVKHDSRRAVEHLFIGRPFFVHEHHIHAGILLEQYLHQAAAAEVIMMSHLVLHLHLAGDEDDFDAVCSQGRSCKGG